jgi:hypothetical protein
MMLKNKNMLRHFTAAFSVVFIFLSTFANCFHSHHPEQRTPVKSSCTVEKQIDGISATSGEHKDCEGDCAACSYLIAAQGVYFDNVNLPEKQDSIQYSVPEPKLFHNKTCIEYLPRAPPYFIV